MHQNHLNNLLPLAKKYLSKSIEEKIYKVNEKIWIPYPKAIIIIEELNNILNHSKKENIENIVIMGDQNNGKSTILNKFTKDNPPYTKIKNFWPVIKFSAPIYPSENTLYEKILDEIKILYDSNDSTKKKQDKVLDILGYLETKIMIIDDFHNILNNKVEKQRRFIKALKYLGNKLQISIVISGRTNIQNPFITNDFRNIISIDKWKLDINFVRLIASFEIALPLSEPSFLYKGDSLKILYNLSEGNIGKLNNIIQQAATIAFQTNINKITPKIIDSLKKK